MYKKAKTGILSLFSVGVVAGLTSCTSTPKTYIDASLAKRTNNHYDESSFYGKVIDVKEINYSGNNKNSNKLPKNEIFIMGERGTLVTYRTNESFSLNEEVLFKSQKTSDIAKVLKVNSLENNMERLDYQYDNGQYYKDIQDRSENLYKDTSNNKNVLDYKNVH